MLEREAEGRSLSFAVMLCLVVGVVVLVQRVARSQEQASPPTLWRELQQTAYIKASNTEAYDHFACGGANQGHTGKSLKVSADGTTMVVGAPYESGGARGVDGDQSDNSVYAAGAAYVYVRQDGGWVLQAYVKASNPGQSDKFGSSVALSRDGNVMAIAAYHEASAATDINGDQDDDSIPQAGAVYVFRRTGTTWAQEAYVKASNTGRRAEGQEPIGDGDQFGYDVSLSGDGTTLAVGAATEDSSAREINGDQHDDSMTSAGAVYIYVRTGDTWAQQAYVKPSSMNAGDFFGYAVALDGNGDTLVASAFDERGAGRTINGPYEPGANGSGALFVFTRSQGVWSQQAYIKGSKSEPTDQLGYSVAISEDGNTIASGAGDEDCLTPGINPAGCDTDSPPRGRANIWVGAAYVFVRTGTTWTEQAYIKASNPRPYSSFGVTIALSADGDTLAVGAYVEDEEGQGVQSPAEKPFLVVDYLDPWRARAGIADEAGAVYLYTRSGTTWTQQAYIKGSNTRAGDEFGSAISLSGDGRILVVGAHGEDGGSTGVNGDQNDVSADDSGAVYVFTY